MGCAPCLLFPTRENPYPITLEIIEEIDFRRGVEFVAVNNGKKLAVIQYRKRSESKYYEYEIK